MTSAAMRVFPAPAAEVCSRVKPAVKVQACQTYSIIFHCLPPQIFRGQPKGQPGYAGRAVHAEVQITVRTAGQW
jgi:hypothetical protein